MTFRLPQIPEKEERQFLFLLKNARDFSLDKDRKMKYYN